MSDSESSDFGDLSEYKRVESKSDTNAASAGVVEIDFTVDMSKLPSKAVSGRVVLNWYSSLNRTVDVVPVVEKVNTNESRLLTATLQLDDEYQHRALAKSGSVTEPSFELGNLRSDSNVAVIILVEERSLMTRRSVYGDYGTAFISVARLVEMSRHRRVDERFSLSLFDEVDQSGQQMMERASIRVRRVSFRENTRRLHALADSNRLIAQNPSPFELNEENLPLIASLTGAAISRGLYPVSNTDNLLLKGTREINTRVVAPWYQTYQPYPQLRRIPIIPYFVNKWAAAKLKSDPPDDEQYLVRVFGYAAMRQNWKLRDVSAIIDKQLDEKSERYDPRFTQCMAIVARGLVLMSNTFDYQSDMHEMSDRAHRFSGSQQHQTENWKYAQAFGGDDCEGLAHYAYEHFQMVRDGTFRSPSLQSIQRSLQLYVPAMMLGTVTSPALGNKHDVEKSAAHLADAEHHHAVITAAGGHENVEIDFVRSEATRVVHKHPIRGSQEDKDLPQGGHSWFEMIPRHKFIELTRRVVPDQKLSATPTTLSGTKETFDAPWRYFPPHLVVEGTGRINPLFMPSAYYAAPGEDRDRLRRADLASMRTKHALIATSTIFQGMQSEAQPTSTVNTPGERLTSFYIQATQCFTDEFLDSTGVLCFNWVRTKPDSTLEESEPDPLFAKGDALTPYKIEQAEANFVHSEAAKSARPKHSAEAFGGVDHAVRAKTLAIGSLVGEGIDPDTVPSELTFGVDLATRIMDRPYAENIGLMPVAGMERVEAKAVASQIRQVYPAEKPSSRLRNFATDPNKPIAYVRVSTSNKNATDPEATARLVCNEKLVGEQRQYVEQVERGVQQLFASEPWLTRKEAAKRSLNLQTFFLSPCDLVNARSPAVLVNEVARFKQSGVVSRARVMLQEPTQNFPTIVLQMLCREVIEN